MFPLAVVKLRKNTTHTIKQTTHATHNGIKQIHPVHPAQEPLQQMQREKGRCRYPRRVLLVLLLISDSATEIDHAAIAAKEGRDAYTVGMRERSKPYHLKPLIIY
jgi:hypothetical protein